MHRINEDLGMLLCLANEKKGNMNGSETRPARKVPEKLRDPRQIWKTGDPFEEIIKKWVLRLAQRQTDNILELIRHFHIFTILYARIGTYTIIYIVGNNFNRLRTVSNFHFLILFL